MNFTTEPAIYVQLADRLCAEILTGKFADDERTPSVPESASLLEHNTTPPVNPSPALAHQRLHPNRPHLG